jgi:hypothetical protein
MFFCECAIAGELLHNSARSLESGSRGVGCGMWGRVRMCGGGEGRTHQGADTLFLLITQPCQRVVGWEGGKRSYVQGEGAMYNQGGSVGLR